MSAETKAEIVRQKVALLDLRSAITKLTLSLDPETLLPKEEIVRSRFTRPENRLALT